jgi:hypothetical protein
MFTKNGVARQSWHGVLSLAPGAVLTSAGEVVL